MVPLEADPEEDEVTKACSKSDAKEALPAEGPAAPISVLSKLALKDAIMELEATLRKTRDASSVAALQLWQTAEKHLGVEVGIDDPAQRVVFGLHVLGVEELFARVKLQTESTLNAVDTWNQPAFNSTASALRALDKAVGNSNPVADHGIAADLADAELAAAKARTRLCMRVQLEVIGAMDARLQEHGKLREDIRLRQRSHAHAASVRREVAWLRKGDVGTSGLRTLNGRTAGGQLEDAEQRLRDTMQQVSDLDGRILQRLMALQTWSIDAVRRPWAALVQIQAEFFMAQQAIWVTLGDAFAEFGELPQTTSQLVRMAEP